MSKIDTTVLKDGQLAFATLEQSGTLISGASAIDTTCLVQTEDGVQQCVKTFPLGEGGGGGTSDYSDLSNKPQINGTTLSGNKSSPDLGVADTSLSNLTAAGKERVANLSMPSSTAENLTFPMANDIYTAPADGIFQLTIRLSGSTYLVLWDPEDDQGRRNYLTCSGSDQLISVSYEATKGSKVKVGYQPESMSSLTSSNNFRFFYKIGSEPQQQRGIMNPADIGLTWKEILYIAFMAGFVWFELKAIRRDIVRLDKKMDKLDEKVQKHNNFDRRIVRLETLVEIKEHEHNAEIQQDK